MRRCAFAALALTVDVSLRASAVLVQPRRQFPSNPFTKFWHMPQANAGSSASARLNLEANTKTGSGRRTVDTRDQRVRVATKEAGTERTGRGAEAQVTGAVQAKVDKSAPSTASAEPADQAAIKQRIRDEQNRLSKMTDFPDDLISISEVDVKQFMPKEKVQASEAEEEPLRREIEATMSARPTTAASVAPRPARMAGTANQALPRAAVRAATEPPPTVAFPALARRLQTPAATQTPPRQKKAPTPSPMDWAAGIGNMLRPFSGVGAGAQDQSNALAALGAIGNMLPKHVQHTTSRQPAYAKTSPAKSTTTVAPLAQSGKSDREYDQAVTGLDNMMAGFGDITGPSFGLEDAYAGALPQESSSLESEREGSGGPASATPSAKMLANVSKTLVDNSASNLLTFAKKLSSASEGSSAASSLNGMMEGISKMMNPNGQAETPTSCGEIPSQFECSSSMTRYNLDCAGWGGESCLEKGAACSDISGAAICVNSKARLGIECAGWGGSSCLEKGLEASSITVESICKHSVQRLGIVSRGWGGAHCLPLDASCRDIKSKSICSHSEKLLNMTCAGWGGQACMPPRQPNSSSDWGCKDIKDESKCTHSDRLFDLSCAGWGGKSCLDHGASAKRITDPVICAHSMKRLGIPSGGWSGSTCLAPDAQCGEVTEEKYCVPAALNLSCAGWGGSSCLARDAHPREITDEKICRHSKKSLKIESAGWGGAGCLARNEVSCHDLRLPGACHNSKRQFGIECKGWGGSRCMAQQGECKEITVERLCKSSEDLFGLRCGGWSDGSCTGLPAGQ